MSNIIKASAIRYTDDIKTVDFNDRANKLQQEFVDNYINENIVLKQIDFDEVSRSLSKNADSDFVPGIAGVASYEIETPSEACDEELEAKRAELAEIEEQIEALRAESEDILAKANEQAEEIVKNALEETEEERRKTISEARAEGYSMGMAQSTEEVEELKAEYQRLTEENNENYRKQVEELEPAFVGLLIKYVRKLTGILAEDKSEIVSYLISEALKNNVRSGDCIIKVSSADYPMICEQKEMLQDLIGSEGTVGIVEDKLLEPGKCFIETESRIFDCSLDEQLRQLTEDLKLLSASD